MAVSATSAGNDGQITGTTAAMEYKAASETVWTPVSSSKISGLVPGVYNVRYAANAGYSAGTAVDVTVSASAAPVLPQPAPTGLSGVKPSSNLLSDGKITGTTVSMEYKRNVDTNWIAASDGETSGLAAGTYLVRFAAKAGYAAGAEATVVLDDYHTTIEAMGAVPTLYSGGYDTTGNSDNNKTVRLRIKEDSAGSWSTERKSHIQFPNGIKVLGYKVTKATNLSIDGISNGGLGTYQDRSTLNRNDYDLFGAKKASEADLTELDIEFFISISSDFSGAVTATINGNAFEGVQSQVIMANAVCPLTCGATPVDVTVGVSKQNVGDLSIHEASAGVWAASTDGSKVILVNLPDGVQWDMLPTVAVTSGDIVLDTSRIAITDGGRSVQIPIKYQSTTPATLTFSGGTVSIANTAADGEYKVSIKGSSVVGNYQAGGSNGYFDTDAAGNAMYLHVTAQP